MPDNPIDRFFAAMAAGDVSAIRTCLTPDARVWHCFDDVAQDVDTALAAYAQMFAYSTERQVRDVRREPIAGGFLQRHVFVLGTAGGRKAWPCCIVVRVEGDRIARFDEYIDRAGGFAVPSE